MKTRCTNCQAVQDIPDHYAGKEVKCQACQAAFTATPYSPPAPAAPPSRVPPNLQSHLPPAHFFESAGVVALLFSTFMFIGSFDEAPPATAASASAVILSFILIGIGSVIRAINANTLAREKSEKSENSS